MKKEDLKTLRENYKFVKKKFNDRSDGVWFEKKIKHKFIKNLTLIVDGDEIIIDIDDFESKSYSCLYKCKFSFKKLDEIIAEFVS